MINLKFLHWLFKERIDRGGSNVYRDFTQLEIDQFINDAVRIVVNQSIPVEGNSFNTSLVSSLLVTAPDQVAIQPTMVGSGRYELKTSDLKYDYFRYERLWVNQGCGPVSVHMETTGRLNDILQDHLQRPSKSWERVYGYLAKDSTQSDTSIYLLCEPGTLIESVSIEYIRYPKKVFFGGYDTIEYLDCVERGGRNCSNYYSSSSAIQDLELPELYASLVIDAAVVEAHRVMENGNAFNLSAEKLTRIN